VPFEEVYPDSDFFLIFLDDSLQEGKKLFLFPGIILRFVYVTAELPHEFDVVHEMPAPGGFYYRGYYWGEYRKSCRLTGADW